MSEIIRFGVSLESTLLRKFDTSIHEKNYTSRSEAIRDLIRNSLVTEEWSHGGEVVATISLVYNHHQRELEHTLTHFQHEYFKEIVSTLHVHLDRENCFEVVVVRGRSERVKKVRDKLASLKGVLHSTFSVTAAGEVPGKQ